MLKLIIGDTMKDEKKIYKKSVFICLFAFLLIVLLTSFSYAFYFYSAEGETGHDIETCSIDMEFTDENSIGLVAAYPIDDDKIDNYDPYIVSVKNDSECDKIYYYLNMTNYCQECTLEDGNCTIGDKTINCSEDYLIDPQYIKYKVVNVTTGEVTTGSNPNFMSLQDSFTTSGKNTYEIRMWISNKASNKDIYVYDAAGNILEDADGKYVTKNFVTRLDTEVSVDKIESENVAIINEDVFNKQDDGSYSNKYAFSEYIHGKINILKYAWKENTRYQISFSGKCPATVGRMYLYLVYTDGTMINMCSVTCNNEFEVSEVVLSAINKTIEKVGLTYSSGSVSASNIFVRDILIKEVR